jgi:hypothetical protein
MRCLMHSGHMYVCCRVSGATLQTPAKITTLASMVAYAFLLTVDPSASVETSTSRESSARKVGENFFISEME